MPRAQPVTDDRRARVPLRRRGPLAPGDPARRPLWGLKHFAALVRFPTSPLAPREPWSVSLKILHITFVEPVGAERDGAVLKEFDMPHRDARAHVHFRTCPHRDAQALVHFRTCSIATRRPMSTFGHALSRREDPDRVSLKFDPIRSSHHKLRVPALALGHAVWVLSARAPRVPAGGKAATPQLAIGVERDKLPRICG